MAESGQTPFTLALVSGGIAGMTVDISLHPIDTVKTRLMSSDGFWKAGGFKGTWKGVVPIALGSAPSAAVFFSCYESAKGFFKNANGGQEHWAHHSVASSLGEFCACSVRVPTVIVANNMQVGKYGSLNTAVSSIYKAGGIAAFWNGFGTMVARDIPFSVIQFPIYEGAKKAWRNHQGGEELNAIQGACCGSLAGSIAGALTTPLEVAKTRIFIDTGDGSTRKYRSTLQTLKTVAQEEGGAALFNGIGPRVFWITLGGFVFFGAYENAVKQLRKTSYW